MASAGDMKEVANGYARNFLLPKKLAMQATPSATGIVEAQRRIIERNQARTQAEMADLAQQIEGKEVTLKAKTGAEDRLYGSITSIDIASALESATGLVVDKKKIELAEPIKQLGSYEVTIKLAKDIAAKIKVIVEKEGTG